MSTSHLILKRPSDPEIEGRSRHGNKNFTLLAQVCTADHCRILLNGALFQVNDIGPFSFQIPTSF
jgi:hypothetical protein